MQIKAWNLLRILLQPWSWCSPLKKKNRKANLSCSAFIVRNFSLDQERIYPLRVFGATLLFTKIDCDGLVCLTIGTQKKAEKKLSLVNRAIATIASSPRFAAFETFSTTSSKERGVSFQDVEMGFFSAAAVCGGVLSALQETLFYLREICIEREKGEPVTKYFLEAHLSTHSTERNATTKWNRKPWWWCAGRRRDRVFLGIFQLDWWPRRWWWKGVKC